jgi:acyl-CoA-binding protein
MNQDPMPGSLSMEQQFTLQALKTQVKGLSLEQAQDYVIEVMRQMMVKDNLIKHLFANEVTGEKR